ncbi:MAG TPA: acyl-CoA-binding protein [Flavobacteriaceae bacterium]|nr:acyl-CoA-binding protein [Flavobacteriaceae bacterium]
MEKLDMEFQKAYERASTTKKKLPQDVMLRLYAYYKHATEADLTHIQRQSTVGTELVSAFKLNSLFQIQNISRREAKQKYIDLVNEVIED